MLKNRCQHGRCDNWYDNQHAQCQLEEGHAGPHINEYTRQENQRKELHPRLSEIRQMVREELERYHAKK